MALLHNSHHHRTRLDAHPNNLHRLPVGLLQVVNNIRDAHNTFFMMASGNPKTSTVKSCTVRRPHSHHCRRSHSSYWKYRILLYQGVRVWPMMTLASWGRKGRAELGVSSVAHTYLSLGSSSQRPASMSQRLEGSLRQRRPWNTECLWRSQNHLTSTYYVRGGGLDLSACVCIF